MKANKALARINDKKTLPTIMKGQHVIHGVFGSVFEELGGSKQLKQWAEENTTACLVNHLEDKKFGVTITIDKKLQLKQPLNFLYGIAKKYKIDFVIGIVCGDTGKMEDVCYFGHEEGRPDMYEIAMYLGL